MGNIYAIGDIHGCLDQLTSLIDTIDIVWNHDTLIFLGDYVDRGKHSYEVVEFLIDLKSRYSGLIFLKGNHDAMFLDFLSGASMLNYVLNGGEQTIESYQKHDFLNPEVMVPKEHLDFFKSLVLCHETEDFIFVHAGLRPNTPLTSQTEHDILWIREPFVSSKGNFGKRVIFGHTPFPKPLVQPNKIGIDTGAVYGNRLTCVKLPDVVFFNAR